MLLLHGWDPNRPDAPFWFTIGGAAEPGETLPEAAAREMLEEVGIAVDPALIGAPIAVTAIMFTWAGMIFDQDQTFFALRMDDVDVNFAGQEALEQATIDKHGWLLPEDLESGAERPADPDLPRVMRLAVATVRGQ